MTLAVDCESFVGTGSGHTVGLHSMRSGDLTTGRIEAEWARRNVLLRIHIHRDGTVDRILIILMIFSGLNYAT
jgi:hypothetical protein